MYNKLYDKSKKLVRNYYKLIIGLLVLVFLYTYELDYQIYTYGKPINLDKRIEVEDAYNVSENFYLTYVEARPGIIPFVLLSYVIPSWDLVSINQTRLEDESFEEANERGKIDLSTVNDYAIKNAFDLANLDYEVIDNETIVYYVFKEASTTLKTGDIIKSVNGREINSSTELTEYVKTLEVGSEVFFEIERNGKRQEKTGIVKDVEGNKIIGIYIVNAIKVKPSKDVTFNYSSNESGPSGGLMSTLEIYNRLVEEDITKGKKIAGTGTINYDGSVGSIGGVKYKLMGAVKNKCEIFIVPDGQNFEEALKYVDENNYDIKLIKATTFKDVVDELKKM